MRSDKLACLNDPSLGAWKLLEAMFEEATDDVLRALSGALGVSGGADAEERTLEAVSRSRNCFLSKQTANAHPTA